MPLLVWFLILAIGVQSVESFPNGAGGCAANQAAVSGPHLLNPVQKSLVSSKDRAFEIFIDGSPYDIDNPHVLIVGQQHNITISSVADDSFKGFLVRGDNVLFAAQIQPDTVQIAMACGENANGVTHTNPSDKTQFSAMFLALEGTDTTMIQLDVTLVVSNSQPRGSLFYYDALSFLVAQHPDAGEIESGDFNNNNENGTAPAPASLSTLTLESASSSGDNASEPPAPEREETATPTTTTTFAPTVAKNDTTNAPTTTVVVVDPQTAVHQTYAESSNYLLFVGVLMILGLCGGVLTFGRTTKPLTEHPPSMERRTDSRDRLPLMAHMGHVYEDDELDDDDKNV